MRLKHIKLATWTQQEKGIDNELAAINEAQERYNVWLRQSSTTPIKQDVGVIKQDVSQQ